MAGEFEDDGEDAPDTIDVPTDSDPLADAGGKLPAADFGDVVDEANALKGSSLETPDPEPLVLPQDKESTPQRAQQTEGEVQLNAGSGDVPAATPPPKPKRNYRQELFDKNRDRFADYQSNPATAEQLAISERFLAGGFRERWLKAVDTKERNDIVKEAVDAEVASRLNGYAEKDRRYVEKDLRARVNQGAQILGDIEGIKPEPKKKKGDDGDGALTSAGKRAAASGWQGLGAMMGFFATGTEWAAGELAARKAAEDGGDEKAQQAARDKAAFDASEKAFVGWLRSTASSLQGYGTGIEERRNKALNPAQKASEDALEQAKKSGTTLDVAGTILTDPRLWLSEGAGLVGQIAATGGAVGGATRYMLARTVGAQIAAKGGAVAGLTALGVAGAEQGADRATQLWDRMPPGERKLTPLFQQAKAMVEASGQPASDEFVSQIVGDQLRRSNIVAQTAIQGVAIAMGGATQALMTRMLGAEMGGALYARMLSSQEGAAGRAAMIAKGAGYEAGVNAGQALAAGAAAGATFEEKAKGGNYWAAAAQHAMSREVLNDAVVSGVAGAVVGAATGGFRRRPDGPPTNPNASKVPPDAGGLPPQPKFEDNLAAYDAQRARAREAEVVQQTYGGPDPLMAAERAAREAAATEAIYGPGEPPPIVDPKRLLTGPDQAAITLGPPDERGVPDQRRSDPSGRMPRDPLADEGPITDPRRLLEKPPIYVDPLRGQRGYNYDGEQGTGRAPQLEGDRYRESWTRQREVRAVGGIVPRRAFDKPLDPNYDPIQNPWRPDPPPAFNEMPAIEGQYDPAYEAYLRPENQLAEMPSEASLTHVGHDALYDHYLGPDSPLSAADKAQIAKTTQELTGHEDIKALDNAINTEIINPIIEQLAGGDPVKAERIRAAVEYAAGRDPNGGVAHRSSQDAPVSERTPDAALGNVDPKSRGIADDYDPHNEIVTAKAARDRLDQTVRDIFSEDGWAAVAPYVRQQGGTWQRKSNFKARYNRAVETPLSERTNADRAIIAADKVFGAAAGKGYLQATKIQKRVADLAPNGGISLDGLRAAMSVWGQKLDAVGIDFQPYPTMDKVPAHLRDEGPGFASSISVDADGKRRLVMVADRIANIAEAEKSVAHEIIGHYAVEQVLGEKRLASLHNAITRGTARDPQLRRIMDQVDRDYPASEHSHADRMNEVIAKIAEDPAEPRGAVRRVLDRLRDLLADAGLTWFERRAERKGSASYADVKTMLREVSDSFNANPVWPSRRFADREYAGQRQVYETEYGTTVLDPTEGREFSKRWVDRMTYVAEMFDALGAKRGQAESTLRALDSLKSDYGTGRVHDQAYRPVIDRLVEIAKTARQDLPTILAWFDRYTQAIHAGEVNQWHWEHRAKIKDAQTANARKQIIDEALAAREYEPGTARLTEKSRVSIAAARARLTALMNKAEAAGHVSPRAEWQSAGLKPGDVMEVLGQVDRRGLSDAFQALNDGEMQNLRSTVLDFQHRSGTYDPVLTELAGYRHYVPRKGGEAEAFYRNPFAAEHSDLQRFNGKTKGRSDIALHGVNQLLSDGLDAAHKTVDAMFLTQTRDAISRAEQNAATAETAKKFASAREVGRAEYEDGRFDYPDRPGVTPDGKRIDNQFPAFDERTGTMHYITMHDKRIAAAVGNVRSSVIDQYPTGFIRGLNTTTKLLARSVTSMNPGFIFRAFSKDLQSTLMTAAAENVKPGEKPGRVKMDFKAVRDTALSIHEAVTSGEARRMFWGTAGERLNRLDLMKREQASDWAELRVKYADKPEAFERAKHLREMAIEYVENGGVIGFAKQADQSIRTGADPLADNPYTRPFQQAGRVAMTALEHIEGVGTVLDNAHRLGLYMNLRRHGMERPEAALRVRQVMDFNQRAGFRDSPDPWNQYMGAAWAFTQPRITGAAAMVNHRIWKDGRIPWQMVQNPDGTIGRKLADNWKDNINIAPIVAFATMGFASAMTAAMVMGRDEETGEDNARKLGLSSWFNSTIVPTGGAPIKVPVQDGIQQIAHSVGVAMAHLANGYYTKGEIFEELYNTAVRNVAALPITESLLKAPTGESSKTEDVVVGLFPAILQPLVQSAGFDHGPFGNRLSKPDNPNSSKYAASRGFSTTPQMYHDVAKFTREWTGFDAPPEIYRQIAKSYTGFAGQMLDDAGVYMTGSRGSMGLWDIGGVPYKRDFSQDSFETRELDRLRTQQLRPHARNLNEAIEKDRSANGGIDVMRGNRRVAGENERAFYEANPDVKQMLTAERNYLTLAGAYAKRIAAARQAGDDDTVQQLRLLQRRDTWELVQALKDEDPVALQRFTRNRQPRTQ